MRASRDSRRWPCSRMASSRWPRPIGSMSTRTSGSCWCTWTGLRGSRARSCAMITPSGTTSAPRRPGTSGSLAGQRTAASRCIPRSRDRTKWFWRSRRRIPRLVSPRKLLHQLVQVFLAREERLNVDSLIFTVRTYVEDVSRESAVSVSRNARVAQIEAVGRAGRHDGHHRNAWPEFRRQPLNRLQQVRPQGRRRARCGGVVGGYGDLVVCEYAYQGVAYLLDRLRGQDAAVDHRPGNLRQGGVSVPTFEACCYTRGAQLGVVRDLLRETCDGRRVGLGREN